MIYIYYHDRDLDGIVSAALVKDALLRAGVHNEYICRRGTDYGRGDEHTLLAALQPGDGVYLVDFSFPLDVMQQINERAILHWCDHHPTRVGAAERAGFLASGGQLTSHDAPAAVWLTWQYLYPFTEAPEPVKLLDEYDSWTVHPPANSFSIGIYGTGASVSRHYTDTCRSRWTGRVLPFQWAARNDHPAFKRWLANPTAKMSRSDLVAVLEQGDTLREAERRRILDLWHRASRVFPWLLPDGTTVNTAAVNALDLSADLWPESVETAGVELYLNWAWDGRPGYRVTVTRPQGSDRDVSAIAEHFGGGGHAGRAGFCCHYLPFSAAMGMAAADVPETVQT